MAIRYLSGVNIDSNTLVVDSTNNRVGIGTASPTVALHIVTGGSTQIRLQHDSWNYWDITSAYNTTNADLYFSMAGAEKFRINASGNVGIGTTSPAYKLDVAGSVRFSNELYVSGVWSTSYGPRNSGEPIKFVNWSATELVRINTTDGNVGIGTTSPNAKLEVNGAVTFSSVDTFGQLVVKAASGATGDMLNIGVDTANSVAFIQAVERGIDVIPLSLQRYGGNVGIGTTSPAEKLHIYGTGDQLLKVENSGTYLMYFGLASNAGYLGSTNATPLNIITNNSSRIYITTSGNVGIGTTSPAQMLHVTGNGLFNGNLDVGQGVSTQDSVINVGAGRTGNGYAYIDLIGDTTYTDYALRIIRNNSGANATSQIIHRGTGDFSLSTNEAANLTFGTSASERMRISSAGALKLNAYGSGSNTGTATQRLAVDASGNVIEIPIGSGPVDGNGTANYVTKWSDADTITNSIIYDNGSTVSMGLGSTTPSYTNAYGYPQLAIESNAFASSHVFTHNNTEGNFSFFALGKSKGTAAAPTIVENSETIGMLQFWAYDGAAYRNTASIYNQIDGTPGAGDTPGRLVFSTTNDGSSSASEKMRITSAGNVGIGTTSPATKLEVSGTFASNSLWTDSGDVSYWGNYSTAYGGLTWDTGFATVFATAGNSLRFGSNGASPDMVIDTSGNVGIGTTSPSTYASMLAIQTTLSRGVTVFNPALSDASTIYGLGFGYANSSKDSAYFGFYKAGVGSNNNRLSLGLYDVDNVLNILGSGNVGIGTTTPVSIGTGITTLDIQGSNAGGVAFGPSGVKNYIYGASTMYVEAHTMAVFATSGSEKMRLTTGGQLIVGGTAVGYAGTKLQVGNTSDSQNGLNILTSTTGYGYILFGDGAGADTYVGQISYYHGDNYMGFHTNGGERMRITSAGNVGIGATDPLRKLHVVGNFAVNAGTGQYYGVNITGGEGTNPNILIGDWHNASANLTWDSTNRLLRIDAQYSTSGAPIVFSGNDAAIEYARFTAIGNLGIGTTSPSNKFVAVNDATFNGENSYSIAAAASSDTGYKTVIGYDYANDIGVISAVRQGIQWKNLSILPVGNTNLGVGTITPSERLHVSGNVRVTGAYYDSNNEAGTSGQVLTSTGSGTDWVTPATTTASSLYDLLPAARTTYDWTVQMTSGTWADIFSSNTVLSNGTWMVQVYVSDFASGGQQYQETYSGVMSWGNASSTNEIGPEAMSEVVLHRSGHAANSGNFYLRTQERAGSTLLLQGMVNYSHTSNTTINFKFVKVF